jgi:hypothetical protein
LIELNLAGFGQEVKRSLKFDPPSPLMMINAVVSNLRYQAQLE